MAKIIKKADENNQSTEFIKSKESLAKYVLKRNLLIRILMLVVIAASLFAYEKQLIAQKQYLIYFSIFIAVLFLSSFIFLRTKLTTYQSYHKSKLSKQDKQAIVRYNKVVKNILSEDSFQVFNNIYLPCGGEYLQQLDSVIVGLANIYIVELLNLEGVIEGMAAGQKWKDKSGEKLVNSYQQNKKHVNEVEKIIYNTIPNEKIKVNNLVVNLAMNSNFNMPDKASHPIFDNLYDALYWLKNKERNREFEISATEREMIIKKLLEVNNNALKQVEYNLNKEILKKYNLEDKFLF